MCDLTKKEGRKKGRKEEKEGRKELSNSGISPFLDVLLEYECRFYKMMLE
jgi:hypothetical protein